MESFPNSEIGLFQEKAISESCQSDSLWGNLLFQLIVFFLIEIISLIPGYLLCFYQQNINLIIVIIPLIAPIILIYGQIFFDQSLFEMTNFDLLKQGLSNMGFNAINTENTQWSKWTIILFCCLINLFVLMSMFGTMWLIWPSTFKQKKFFVDFLFLDFIIDLVLSMTLWAGIFFFVSIGEEVAWRGFLAQLTTDYFSHIWITHVINAIIWTIFHYPFIFGLPSLFFFDGMGVPTWILAINFTILISSISTVMVTLRLKTNSILPCLLLHAFHNAIVPMFYLRTEVTMLVWVGQGGIIHGLIWMLIAIVFHLIF